jgi:hypothetical protein
MRLHTGYDMKISYLLVSFGLALVVFMGPARANEPVALTPVGAEQGSNADGSIPAWTGGFHPGQMPRAHTTGDRPRDPFPDEKPLFVITRDNYQQHAAQLSEGHQRMFERYATYRMPVFATHRTAAFPEVIYQATAENKGRARLEGTDNLSGARLGFPFPAPSKGAEVVWNHKLRYRTDGVIRWNNEAIVQENGIYTLNRRLERAKFLYASLNHEASEEEGLMGYYQSKILEPTRKAGPVVLIHDTLNPLAHPRRAWIYNPGQRRTRRAPQYGYDDPAHGADGMAFVDQLDMFNGPLDRYDWSLVGKREVYIPYNAYRLSDDKLKYTDILTRHHINQAHTRYELHRVWVVEAKVKAGSSHAFAQRRFYVDEDSWGIVLADLYDRRGEYWRFQEGHPVTYYHVPTVTTIPEIVYDLFSGKYIITAMNNEDKPYQPAPKLTAVEFSVGFIGLF